MQIESIILIDWTEIEVRNARVSSLCRSLQSVTDRGWCEVNQLRTLNVLHRLFLYVVSVKVNGATTAKVETLCSRFCADIEENNSFTKPICDKIIFYVSWFTWSIHLNKCSISCWYVNSWSEKTATWWIFCNFQFEPFSTNGFMSNLRLRNMKMVRSVSIMSFDIEKFSITTSCKSFELVKIA